MRLIDGDNILQDFCAYCTGDGCDGGGVGSIQECEGIGMLRDILNAQPTIDAIPVEQVARIITRVTSKMPCDIADEMCPRENGKCAESACWEYAIKEGWLGD